jgi:hypothetical protein
MRHDAFRKMQPWRATAVCLVMWVAFASLSRAERDRLYTEIDPTSQGGITGEITHPAAAIVQILAIPPDEPRCVYKGDVTGTRFSFRGLPMRKYDLVVIYDNSFYEGLNLNRGSNTLTAADHTKIETTIKKCEPYFTDKVIHRVEGNTGRGNQARCICTFRREDKGQVRRTFKVLMLQDVGPGWQIVRARDLYPLWTPNGKPVHTYRPRLGGIRVTDHVTDLGTINLDL